MTFTNLNNHIFWALKGMSAECYYSLATNWKCWKFWFNKELGVAIIKHNSFTQNDCWSVMAIARRNNEIVLIDEPWYNINDKDILKYANIIRCW